MELVPVPLSTSVPTLRLYKAVGERLRSEGIHQWDRFYPNGFIVRRDAQAGHLFGIELDGKVVAAIVLDSRQSGKYKGQSWSDAAGRPGCIHRLAVHPDYQGRGLGKSLLRFAEEYLAQQGYTSIRLDVYAANETAVGMYERAGYEQTGEIRYPLRKVPYYCYEKLL